MGSTVERQLMEVRAIQSLEMYRRRMDRYTDGWLGDQARQWRRAINDTQMALVLADKYYNRVLSAEKKPSIFEAVLRSVITGLAGLNPEFAMFAVVLELANSGEGKLHERREKTIDGVKSLVKDGFDKAQEAMEEAEKIERDETNRDVVIGFFQSQMEALSVLGNHVDVMETSLQKMTGNIAYVGQLSELTFVQSIWGASVGYAKPYPEKAVLHLASLMLYDMMRVYCKQNVRLVRGDIAYLPINKAQIVAVLKRMEMADAGKKPTPDWLDDIPFFVFQGLDDEKRQKMFGYLKDYKGDLNRPPISNWKELVRNWDFQN